MRSKKLISKESPQAEKISKQIFPVVGIGASAGGLDAFKKFIKAIPPGSGMAYILVQHLHPDHISALPEILQRETSIPVIEVSDNIEVAPDTVYIIPVNKMLVAKDGILHLSPRPSDKKNRLIDVFFSSLAEVHHNQAIGIVLSGTGTDGTDGLKKIKDEGGLTMAQDKDSAAYEEMPENAIQSEVVDFVIPLKLCRNGCSILQKHTTILMKRDILPLMKKTKKQLTAKYFLFYASALPPILIFISKPPSAAVLCAGWLY